MIDFHNNILDKLLKTNGLQCDIVHGDGIFFFQSLLKCTETELSRSCSTASEIRQKVCNYNVYDRECCRIYALYSNWKGFGLGVIFTEGWITAK